MLKALWVAGVDAHCSPVYVQLANETTATVHANKFVPESSIF